MKVREYLKTLLILLSIWLCFFVTEKSVLAEDLTEGAGTNTVTGSAITFYLGGDGASDTNDGLSSSTPFATLYQATSTINSKSDGEYEILVQGDTTETQTSIIGRYNDYMKSITIKNLTDNVYTINRGSNIGVMIRVNSFVTLILGNQDGSDTINLIFNGDNNSEGNSSIIENDGYLNLYNGISLRNNKCLSNYGSAVHNRFQFKMYGGEICNNNGLKYGAVFNQSSFKMYNGKIHNNHSSSNGGGIYNYAGFDLYGGSISSNTCEGQGAGVYNCSIYFHMHGGIIAENIASLDAGGVYSESGFIMEDGNITANSAILGLTGGVCFMKYGIGLSGKMSGGSISGNNGIGVNVEDFDGFIMSGGSISGNKIGVNVKTGGVLRITGGSITNNTMIGVDISGDLDIGEHVSIHSNGDLSTNIILNSALSHVYLLSTISDPIYVTPYDYITGRLVLIGPTNDIKESYTKICFPDTQYTLNGIGRIVPKDVTLTYYVGGTNTNDSNDGLSSTNPFATLEHAALAVDNGSGTIIVQSDLSLKRPVLIKGNITIKSVGNIHIIKRDKKYSCYQSGSCNIWSMIIVYGRLTLGDASNTAMMQRLIFDAYLDGAIYTDGSAETIYIEAGAEGDMYKGVTLQKNNWGAAILNKGNFNMHEGIICDNEGPYVGGVYNCQNGIFTMSGGSIDHNNTQGSDIDGVKYGSGGVFNKDNSSFTMTGGIISYNNGYSSGGVYNGTNCTFHMTGGRLEQYYNVNEDYAYDVFNDAEADFIIEQNASINADDGICLVTGSKITINNKLLESSLMVKITPVKLNISTKRFEAIYVPGTQLITNGNGYNFSENELNNIFSLSSIDYQINDQGILVKSLNETWVNLPQGTDYTYTGSAITPTITIVDGTTILQHGIDYTVTYVNNLSAGLKIIAITGKGNYVGLCTKNYAINPAVATAVITEIMDKSFSSDDGYNIAQLINTLNNTVKVQFNGGEGNLSVNWILTGGTFDYKGGSYTFTGTLRDNDSILAGGLMLTTHVTVTPVVAKVITYHDTSVSLGKNKTATSNDLGKSILPTSGSYYQEGAYNLGYPNPGTITYTIDWGNQKLNTTNNKYKTTFIGKVTYVNYPEWLTIPENVTVTRTVGVTGKSIVDIQCDIDSKTYDGKPVTVTVPSNEQGYTGEYEYRYISTDGKGYASTHAPKNAGEYKYIISVPETNTSFTGSKEIYFHILKKNLILRADNKTILLNESLPTLTYQCSGGGLISGDTWIMLPTVSVPTADITKVSDYTIKMEADAGENYSILLEDGVLSVVKPDSYSIMVTAGGNGTITPNGIVTVLPNTSKTFEIRPNLNYRIASVIVDGVEITKVYSYTFRNVEANHSIKVIFEEIPVDKPPVAPPPPFIPYFPPASDDTTTPSISPTPTVVPNQGNSTETEGIIRLIGSDMEASISIEKDEERGSLSIAVDLTGDVIHNQNGSQNQPKDITIPINSDQLMAQIENEKIKEINIAITIPKELQSDNNINSVLGKDILAAAKEDGKDITVSISDDGGQEQYAWTFTGGSLADSEQDLRDVNLSLKVEAINDTELKELLSNSEGSGSSDSPEIKGLVIDFNHHGDLPSQASVRIYVGNQEGVKTGDKVLLYHYNSETNRLDSLPYSSGYTVDEDGYVTIQILHCSNYVLLPEAPENSIVTALIDQVSANVTDKILYFGGTIGDSGDYIIEMPSTLEWVSSKDKTSNSAVGAVNIKFTSNNSKVASVDSKGHIIAKSTGTCTISAKVSLYNGDMKTYKTSIVVKEPIISLSKNKKAMKVGDTILFEAKIEGYKQENITWSTTEKSLLTINSKTGKATAVSPGVDYVVAQVGNKKVKVKVIVSK